MSRASKTRYSRFELLIGEACFRAKKEYHVVAQPLLAELPANGVSTLTGSVAVTVPSASTHDAVRTCVSPQIVLHGDTLFVWADGVLGEAWHARPICAFDISCQTLPTGGLQSWATMTTTAMRKRRSISARWPLIPGTASLCLPLLNICASLPLQWQQNDGEVMLVQVGDAELLLHDHARDPCHWPDAAAGGD